MILYAAIHTKTQKYAHEMSDGALLIIPILKYDLIVAVFRFQQYKTAIKKSFIRWAVMELCSTSSSVIGCHISTDFL